MTSGNAGGSGKHQAKECGLFFLPSYNSYERAGETARLQTMCINLTGSSFLNA